MLDLTTRRGMQTLLRKLANRALKRAAAGSPIGEAKKGVLEENSDYQRHDLIDQKKIAVLLDRAVLEMKALRLPRVKHEPFRAVTSEHILPRSRQQEYSNKDRAAGAEAEDRRDALMLEFPAPGTDTKGVA